MYDCVLVKTIVELKALVVLKKYRDELPRTFSLYQFSKFIERHADISSKSRLIWKTGFFSRLVENGVFSLVANNPHPVYSFNINVLDRIMEREIIFEEVMNLWMTTW